MQKSRTKNSARNVAIAMISKILYLIINFICRTIFIKILGTEYLGINGLFTNVLTILSFAELGIGNAIIFKLYKPIAEEDHERIKTLLNFYKRVYFFIGIFILCCGLAVIPFMKFIINENVSIKENLSFIYFLFLLNTVISYFFTYKKSIITGYQQEYIINLIDLIVFIIQSIIQIVLLNITHNYIAYLITLICSTCISNIIIGIIADKMYPYIKEKKYKKISKDEQKSIFRDVKSLMVYKIGYTLSNGTDNIIISSFLGVVKVGLLSNYTMISSAITTLLSTAFNSLTASIGNLNTINEEKKKEDVFYQILFLSFVVYGYIATAMSLLLNRFIILWIGIEYVLAINISIALGFNLYIDGMRFVNYTFRNTAGLFKKGRLLPLISSIANIVLSVILVQYIGMFGVLIATGLTRLFILTWYDPYMIHKYVFKSSSKRYYITYLLYLIILIFNYIVNWKLLNMMNINGIVGFILCGLLITQMTFIIFFITTFRLKEVKEVFNRIKQIIKR